MLCPGVLVICVSCNLSILSFATNCQNVFLSGCMLAFLKFLKRKEVLKNNFSRVGEVEALTTALACGSAFERLWYVLTPVCWFDSSFKHKIPHSFLKWGIIKKVYIAITCLQPVFCWLPHCYFESE